MIQLTTHEQFQQLLSGKSKFLVWFSAAWCKPCQAMDKARIEEAAAAASLPLYYCDETVNATSADSCNVKVFPTFAIFHQGLCISARKSADTTKVCQYIAKA